MQVFGWIRSPSEHIARIEVLVCNFWCPKRHWLQHHQGQSIAVSRNSWISDSFLLGEAVFKKFKTKLTSHVTVGAYIISQWEERSIDGAGGLSYSRPPFSIHQITFQFPFFSPITSSRSDHAVERFSLALRSLTHLRVFFHFYFLCFSSPHLFTTGNYSNNLCCINVSMGQRVNVIVTRLFSVAQRVYVIVTPII